MGIQDVKDGCTIFRGAISWPSGRERAPRRMVQSSLTNFIYPIITYFLNPVIPPPIFFAFPNFPTSVKFPSQNPSFYPKIFLLYFLQHFPTFFLICSLPLRLCNFRRTILHPLLDIPSPTAYNRIIARCLVGKAVRRRKTIPFSPE